MQEHGAAHMAALVAHMPVGQSALYTAMNPDNGWTPDQVLMARLINDFAMFMWGMADRKSRGQEPKPIGPSWMRDRSRKLEARVMGVEELLNELSKPRR